jgi:hypothetical protein
MPAVEQPPLSPTGEKVRERSGIGEGVDRSGGRTRRHQLGKLTTGALDALSQP